MFAEQSTPGDAFEWDARTIRALRAFLGWSQSALARDLGIRQQTVSEWETGMYKPRGASVTILSLLARTAGFDASTAGRTEKEPGRPGTHRSMAPHTGLLAAAVPSGTPPALQRVPGSPVNRAAVPDAGGLLQSGPAGPAREDVRYPLPGAVPFYIPGEEVPM